MKYLQSFNESNKSFTYEEIVQEISDILLPISDMGYDIDVKLVKDYNYFIFINILSYKDRQLKVTHEIMDDIDRLSEVIDNNGFRINMIYYKNVEADGRIFNRGHREVDTYHGFKEYIKDYDKKLAYLTLELKEISK